MTTFRDKSPNTHEVFDAKRFAQRERAAQAIAVHFGAPVTSGLRETVPPGGSTTSLHLKANGALAFDFGGPDPDKEIAVCQWAAQHPDLFQEVMHHDVGSGLHAHIVFEANLDDVDKKVRRLLGTATQHGPKAPKWPGRVLELVDPAMEGKDVEQWQKRMAERGWKIQTSGTYDKDTSKVCTMFQEKKDLEVTGKVDRETWRGAWVLPIG